MKHSYIRYQKTFKKYDGIINTKFRTSAGEGEGDAFRRSKLWAIEFLKHNLCSFIYITVFQKV